MKLRIKGDSLRLRLTQAEVSELEAHGVVADCIRFGGGAQLFYRLTRDRHAQAISAGYSDGVIDVRVPDQAALKWCRSAEEVTLSGAQPAAADAELRLVVEKDFACLTAREGEDESDNFPNPRQSC
jgi:hypothetical protein